MSTDRSDYDILNPEPISDGDGMCYCNQNYGDSIGQRDSVNDTRMEALTYNSDTVGYTTCYNPEKTDNITCAKDRNNNPLYSCFPYAGETQAACRSTCIRGTKQDYTRTLYDDLLNDTNMCCAERGVELYENYGLDTTLRQDSGNYGGGNDTGTGCITELGRKISIFGNTSLTIETGDFNISTFGKSWPYKAGSDSQCTVNNYDVIYTITFYISGGSSSGSSDEPNSNYFGNYGVVFECPTSSGRQKYPFIYGYIDASVDTVGFDNNVDGSGSITYYVTSSHFISGSRYKGVSIAGNNVSSGDCDTCGDRTYSAPPFPPAAYFSWPCRDCGDGYEQSGPTDTPFICNYTGVRSIYIPPHMGISNIAYWLNGDSQNNFHNKSDISNYISTSLYYSYDFNNNTNYVNSLPIYSSASRYNNGTFHCMTGTAPGASVDSVYVDGVYKYTTSADRTMQDFSDGSAPIDDINGSANKNTIIPIPACSLISLRVFVRQDSTFFNKYVAPYNNAFAPEIMLVPGVQIAKTFPNIINNIGTESLASIQKLINPNDMWDPSKNDQITQYLNTYSDGNAPLAMINPYYKPGDVIVSAEATGLPQKMTFPSGSTPTTKPTCEQVVSATKNKTGQPQTQNVSTNVFTSLDFYVRKLNNAIEPYAKRALSRFRLGNINLTTTTVTPPTSGNYPLPKNLGKYRIVAFDSSNYVMSVEWLYVLYHCAITGLENIQFNTSTGEYENYQCSPSTTNTCDWECMLFKDPYYINFPGGNSQSAADVFMTVYCNMRNLSIAYAWWEFNTSVTSNTCSCVTTQQYCPTQYDASLCPVPSAGYVGGYVPDATATQECSAVCSYCNIRAVQITFALFGCNTGVSQNQELPDECKSCKTSTKQTVAAVQKELGIEPDGGGGGGGNGKGQNNFSDYIWVLMFVIILIVAIAAVSTVVYMVYRGKHPR